MGKIINPVKRLCQWQTGIFIIMIRIYALILSPFFGQRCRFYPSCSSYARKALEQHGLLKGGYFTFKRLLRCHPLSSGGFDYVPKIAKEAN